MTDQREYILNSEDITTVGRNSGWVRANGVLHLVVGNTAHREGATFDKEDALDARRLIDTLAADAEQVVSLTDIRNLTKTSAQARRVPIDPRIERLAFLVRSPVSRMIGNAYLGIHKPACKTKLFSNEDLAVAWLTERGSSAHDG